MFPGYTNQSSNTMASEMLLKKKSKKAAAAAYTENINAPSDLTFTYLLSAFHTPTSSGANGQLLSQQPLGLLKSLCVLGLHPGLSIDFFHFLKNDDVCIVNCTSSEAICLLMNECKKGRFQATPHSVQGYCNLWNHYEKLPLVEEDDERPVFWPSVCSETHFLRINPNEWTK